MNRRITICVLAVLFSGFVPDHLTAQTTDNESSSVSTPSEQTATADVAQAQPDAEQPTVYVPTLNGTGLIAMDSTLKTHLLIGGTTSGGWDSNPNDLANGSASGVLAFSPYFGVQVNSSKAQYIFQYQPTIRRYSSSLYDGGAMNLASAQVESKLSERWRLDLKATASHGQDSIRLLAPVQTEAIGNVAGAGSGTASYLPNAGTVTYANADVGVHYDLSQRDVVELRATNSFSRYSGLQQTSSIAGVLVSYQRAMSKALSLSAYGQPSYYYGSINCSTLGFGAGIAWKPSEYTGLSLSGGPQLNSNACGKQQGFSYNFAFNTRLSEKSQIYATAARQMTTTYLGPGLWQQNFSAGYQRQLSAFSTFGADVGRVSSDALAATDSYHGTYFDANYIHRLAHSLRASVSFRSYTGNWGQTNFNRNAVLFSLAWTPDAGHLFQ